MMITQLDSTGQTTVPKKVRSKLRLRAGMDLTWRIEADGTARVIPKRLSPRDVCGFLADKPHKNAPLTQTQMDEAIRKAVRRNWR